MGIPKVVGFPFPSPPEKSELFRSEKLLVQLGAVKPVNLDKITDPKKLEEGYLFVFTYNLVKLYCHKLDLNNILQSILAKINDSNKNNYFE